ncbi:RNA polymerase III subunit Rpc25-domain-containing protein [Zopfochytrium polystomum]|nr:RNA polymerase III subunit Rpc25-domain-containing protein [Zopfochytrium polystomum]
MFFVVTEKDRVKVLASNFTKPRAIAVTEELNVKYANKVLHNVGLCIRVFDILELGDGLVHACQDGSYILDVKFRIIVFRPFVGEILVGRVANSSTDGLRITMDFFDDIIVPEQAMKEGITFDKAKGMWVWNYEDEDDPSSSAVFPMTKGEPIKFKVEGETFVDVPPPPPSNLPPEAAPLVENIIAPYSLTCSIIDDGLGLLSWWS